MVDANQCLTINHPFLNFVFAETVVHNFGYVSRCDGLEPQYFGLSSVDAYCARLVHVKGYHLDPQLASLGDRLYLDQDVVPPRFECCLCTRMSKVNVFFDHT